MSADKDIGPDINDLLCAGEYAWLQNGPKGVRGLFLRAVNELDRLRAKLEAVRKIHDSLAIFDTCNHEHEDADESNGIFDVDNVGITCNKVYEVCRRCCCGGGDSQTEECLGHGHSLGKPICPTIAALEGASDE